MLKTTLYIVPVSEGVEISMPLIGVLNEVLLDVHDVIHRIVYLWLLYGADMSAEILEAEMAKYIDELMQESGIEEYFDSQDKVNEVFLCIGEVAKNVFKDLQPFFKTISKITSSSGVNHAEVVKGDDHDLHIRVKFNKSKMGV